MIKIDFNHVIQKLLQYFKNEKRYSNEKNNKEKDEVKTTVEENELGIFE